MLDVRQRIGTMFEKPSFKWIEPKEAARRRDLKVERSLPKWAKFASIPVIVLILLAWKRFTVDPRGVESPPFGIFLLGAFLFSVFGLYLLPVLLRGRPSRVELSTTGIIRIFAGSVEVLKWKNVSSFLIRDYEVFSVLSLQKDQSSRRNEYIVPAEIVVEELERFLGDMGITGGGEQAVPPKSDRAGG